MVNRHHVTPTLPALTPTRACYQDTEHPGWPGLRAGAGHPGGGTRFFYVMLLTKTKIQLEAYSHNRLGYDVTCLAARLSSARGAQGGVRLVTRERPVGWILIPHANMDITW